MNDAHSNFGPQDVPTVTLPVSAGAPGGPGKRRWSRGRQVATLAAVFAVVGGGAFAVAEAATSSPAATDAASSQTVTSQAGTSASGTSQLAALRGVLGSTGARRLARLRLLGGMYGQYTFQTKAGSRTLAFERGTVTSVTGGDVVIRAANGTTWTWEITGTSVVREHGTKEAPSTLAQGQSVLAAGPVTNGAKDARVIVIRAAGTTPKSSAAA
ncbi:MAG TPA: hypothetical protein VMG38_23165 [Trebonia sp.]|nr:hypothetical protein [Trebonia sp.]